MLASGKNFGLGLAVVDGLTHEEFVYYWHCQQSLLRNEDENSRTDAKHEASARRTIRLEESGKLDTQEPGYLDGRPFDPSTASPREIDAWLARMQQ